ncbi:hypothetical protein QBC37DRAFT_44442 [Rhypophila decipiens]|uniref:FAD dependent oxidoreductase domain-containing protein n=1 Tax=Rhypophila decipiens TaxID=261697 RepID=A0AAN7B228_9PEZI|nr:hypothetical protein QBC37DRAFT_44442 [Rhypophila decipiens]
MDATPTVILGAGIIGVSTAYYLSEHQDPSTIHIVESAPEMFSSASGYAGGFLARDWHVPATAELGILSFEEHRRLAEKFGGREKWGYSVTLAVGYEAPSEGVSGKKKKRGDDWLRDGTSRADAAPTSSPGSSSSGGSGAGDLAVEEARDAKSPPWLRRRDGDRVEVVAEEGTTAQVDPLLLCRFLLGECVNRGVKIHQPARAVGLEKDSEGKMVGVVIATASSPPSGSDGQSSEETITVPCSRIIITAGAWSGRVFKDLFPGSSKDAIAVKSLAGHSVVFKSPRWYRELESKGCHTVFTTSEEFAPEIFARLGDGIYFAGLNSADIPLPEVAGSVKPHAEAIELLKKTAGDIMGSDGPGKVNNLEVIREGLCFRPVTPWGLPIISRVPDEVLGHGLGTRSGTQGGVYVATGHGPWGISLSLGTGKVLAEMVQGRQLSADVGALGLRVSANCEA